MPSWIWSFKCVCVCKFNELKWKNKSNWLVLTDGPMVVLMFVLARGLQAHSATLHKRAALITGFLQLTLAQRLATGKHEGAECQLVSGAQWHPMTEKEATSKASQQLGAELKEFLPSCLRLWTCPTQVIGRAQRKQWIFEMWTTGHLTSHRDTQSKNESNKSMDFTGDGHWSNGDPRCIRELSQALATVVPWPQSGKALSEVRMANPSGVLPCILCTGSCRGDNQKYLTSVWLLNTSRKNLFAFKVGGNQVCDHVLKLAGSTSSLMIMAAVKQGTAESKC